MAADTPRRRGGALVRFGGLLLVAGFIALLVFGLVAQAPKTGIDDQLAKSQPAAAPGFELAALAAGRPGPRLAERWRRAAADGKVNLDELRGTPVVLNLWASWCVPCRDEAPVLRRGAERWRQRGVLFVGLNMQDVTEDARTFLREYALDFPQVRDRTNETARRWGATGIPETFFIDARGRVVAHAIGTVTVEQLDSGAAAAQSGRPLAVAHGGDQRPTR